MLQHHHSFNFVLSVAYSKWLSFCYFFMYVHCEYLLQSERNEHWRRLEVWSFCNSVLLCVYMMTHNGNGVIVPTAQAERWLLLFPPFPLPQSGSSFFHSFYYCRV